MNNHIIISGCSGGGKSMVIEALAAKGFQAVEEAGRRIVEAGSGLKNEALPWVNMPLFLEHAIELALSDFDRADLTNSPVFYDRSLVDLILAYKYFTGRSTFDHHLKTKRYTQTVFLVPPWKEIYVKDKARRHSFVSAVEEYERLKTGYPSLGYNVEILPQTNVSARMEYILSRLKDE